MPLHKLVTFCRAACIKGGYNFKAQTGGKSMAIQSECAERVSERQLVERWQQILGGMREAESALGSRTADKSATFDPNAFIQV